MSIHSDHQDYICPKCTAKFVPFRKDMDCLSCGVKVNEYFDFIEETLKAFRHHKSKSGRYFPNSWYIGSQVDRFQATIFQIFDSLEFEKEEPADKKQYILDKIGAFVWKEDSKYMEKNYNEIVMAFFDRYMEVRDDLLATGISHQEALRQEEEVHEQWRLKNEKKSWWRRLLGE